MGDVVGCGIDVVEIARIDSLLLKYGAAFTGRWFAAAEVAACAVGESPGARFAACLAAKEAVVKVLGMDGRGPVPWRYVEVQDLAGRPDVRLSGEPAAVARRRGIARIFVTVSVGEEIATAVAIGSAAHSAG